ncbi:phage scaffolding protein [Ethanoligenens harbinense]|uniref:Putative scaffolding protein n=1 Tax=Ethanoligenens harbinense (strain DSM 18485 / JCM 12961 / CGMCC 1.5033 / YUAN-3) TaxID=663278 RepID=E6U918_ETHHY|nr:phage scaffolding protein [Ethanoligenens harbinense]ADU26082.1 putative scaffolding protein [Ethanoligenens harbinense YUAN-3]AVQ95225.1 hypothetical protein CXQ68_02580 [Ethanoligenens harbinense YUAN-3]AYF37916.1 hypothetical protein CXP51_02595 [Ethanoligenens harbinense]AYF40636.1 hypothetical protein CN246_02580 [Ethanoligenens harbinense]QCN91470.1 hypothetical protein DRA42_02590 [Ethanoligenens harbinense]
MKREDITALGIGDEATVNKIMDLHGADLEKQKNTITTLTAERDGLKTQLGEANGKLAGYDPEWKTKAATAQQEADGKVAALQYEFAAATAVNGMKFTSESAKKAFLADLVAKKLPLQDGKLLGYDDFTKSYKETDPGAFVSDAPAPHFGGSTPGPAADTLTGNDKANAALREAFGRVSQ